jgi:hypothetical protein
LHMILEITFSRMKNSLTTSPEDALNMQGSCEERLVVGRLGVPLKPQQEC